MEHLSGEFFHKKRLDPKTRLYGINNYCLRGGGSQNRHVCTHCVSFLGGVPIDGPDRLSFRHLFLTALITNNQCAGIFTALLKIARLPTPPLFPLIIHLLAIRPAGATPTNNSRTTSFPLKDIPRLRVLLLYYPARLSVMCFTQNIRSIRSLVFSTRDSPLSPTDRQLIETENGRRNHQASQIFTTLFSMRLSQLKAPHWFYIFQTIPVCLQSQGFIPTSLKCTTTIRLLRYFYRAAG